MKPSENLSSIEKVALREVWLNEAQDFTPWLAEHLSELGQALGLDLELEAREAPVGGYSLDILRVTRGVATRSLLKTNSNPPITLTSVSCSPMRLDLTLM